MYHYHAGNLPGTLGTFFSTASTKHSYNINTRFASKKRLHFQRCARAMENLLFVTTDRVWHDLDESIKILNIRQFKKELKLQVLSLY